MDPVIGRFLSNDAVGFSEGAPQMFNRYSYTLNDPVNEIDPDGNALPVALAACAANAACVTLTAAGIALAVKTGGDIVDTLKNDSSGSGATESEGPRSLTDSEKTTLSEAGKEQDKGGRTKAGRAAEKHGSRPGSAFPPTTGDAESINEQGQGTLEGILEDEGSTIEVDDRGRTTVTAPDGRAARFNPDGSMQGFREPEGPDKEL